MDKETYPTPGPNETVLAYAERLYKAGSSRYYKPLEKHFGLSPLAAKAVWLALESFNTEFAYRNWKERIERSSGGYGARHWVKRKYKLDDDVAQHIDAEFRAGNKQALADVLGFEGFARVSLSAKAQASLQKEGILKSADG